MENFTIIPNKILDNYSLSMQEQSLLIAIISYYNDEKGYAYPNYEQLKIRSKIKDNRTLVKNMNLLIEKSIVSKKVLKGRGCRYYLNLPSGELHHVENSTTCKTTLPPSGELHEDHVENSTTTNTNINTNTNTNIYYSSSEVEKELLENNKKIDEEELKADLKKDLIQKINSKYPKELIKEEFNKLKPKGLDTLDMLNELDKNLKSKNKIKKDKYSEDSKEYKLSILLRDLILERDSNSRCRNANMQSWSKYIDLLHRKDNRSYEDIENIIKWSQQDNFWKSNILSTQKLREKFDTLYQKYNSGQASHKNCNSNKLHDESEKDEYDWYWKNSFKIN
ncbi:MarR family transcriptional regulator [Clostridium thermobutyricum]|uniref:MarR family transcriptional regulator n=1 Tax=Clostridium thermobutyricum TaxID=29372 RepID=UPI0018ABE518|nr:MarR family transcriptional regulator [Clostridium thermobutyricum]